MLNMKATVLLRVRVQNAWKLRHHITAINRCENEVARNLQHQPNTQELKFRSTYNSLEKVSFKLV